MHPFLRGAGAILGCGAAVKVMSEDGSPPSLEDLDSRLKKARKARWPERDPAQPASNMGLGFRVAIEMAAAVAVAVGIGWFLDGWLGTRPWLMIVFLAFGFAAGVLNAYRVASRQVGSPAARTRTDESRDSEES
ncbi:MAG: AtpZ/AtpI family protein [Alphaproteobacteria bacterium]